MFDQVKKNTKILFFLLCAVITIPAVIGLMHPGFPLTDDGNWMVIRFSAFYEALRSGQFPVRFLFRLNNGFGYPVADFLYPLFMYIGVPIHILGFSFVDSIKVILGLSLVFSSVFTFLWLRKLFDNLSSFVSATLYVYFPYHLWDVYKRGSVGEVLALTVLPFIFWQIENENFSLISLGIALLIMSHNSLAFIFLPFVLLYMVIKKYNVRNLIKTFILGLGLSAFFWIPAIFDLQYTVFSQTQVSDWSNYFSNFNLIGLSAVFIILITVILIVGRKIDIKKRRLTLLMLLLGIISIFFASSSSSYFWNFLPVSFIQFPFRLLSVAIVCVSFLSCCIVSVLKGKIKIILAITILAILFISSKQFIFPSNFQYYPDTFYSTNQDTTTVKNEYMPKWVKKIPSRRFDNRLEIIKGDGKNYNIQDKGNEISFNLRLKQSSLVQVNTIYFPGWKISIDKKSSQIIYNNKKGVIQFNADKGNHLVEVKFQETNIRLISDLISLGSLFLIGYLMLKRKNYL